MPSKTPPSTATIDVTLRESRVFKPPADFAEAAVFQASRYEAVARRAQADPEGYWSEAALELDWFSPWESVLEWDPPRARWFSGGHLNASYNCLDRHLATIARKVAITWEGEPGEIASWSYQQLHAEVEKLTASLRKLGLKPGDRVAIYMPMVPEAAVALLACARGGFTHTVVFAGFSAEALKDRVLDAGAALVITADGGYRKGSWLDLKSQVDRALESCPSVRDVITLSRARAGKITASLEAPREGASASTGRGEWDYHDLLARVTSEERKRLGFPEKLDAEHPLFILYTSGTTGKPKGIVHSTGGYLTGVLRTTRTVFDLKPNDLYWCTADIGWVTGHSYVVYGPLAAGASILIYEGAPTHPDPDRFWALIERHRVSVLYTAPTAIRAFMKLGERYPRARDLSSLRLLGTVGEPINPEAWIWYRETVGGSRCPVVDTYWQTETGAIVVSPLPGVTSTKPGSATLPLPGYDVDVVDKSGRSVAAGTGGYLVIRKPWPSMARTIHGDPERFKSQYFSEIPGVYFSGDGARRDEDGYIWCLGRVDDVLNVSGHRLGTMEIESALVAHPDVAEAAVVGRPDALKGQAVVAFVTLKLAAAARAGSDEAKLQELREALRAHVAREIGAFARPDDIRLAESLPKTRSGKIMRRLLRELATTGDVKGDTSTLEDLAVIATLQGEEE